MNQELEIKKEVEPILATASSIKITNKNELQFASEFLRNIKTAQKKIKEYWNPLKKKAYEAWKQITAKENEMLKPLENAERNIKQKIAKFEFEERQRIEEEKRKLQAKLEAQARKERERLLKKADKLKTPELKEKLLEEAEQIEAPEIHIEADLKVEGISYKTIWKAKVIDKKTFVEAALKDENLLSFVLIDEKKLNKIAQATKGQLNYPGIKFYSEKIVSAKS